MCRNIYTTLAAWITSRTAVLVFSCTSQAKQEGLLCLLLTQRALHTQDGQQSAFLCLFLIPTGPLSERSQYSQ